MSDPPMKHNRRSSFRGVLSGEKVWNPKTAGPVRTHPRRLRARGGHQQRKDVWDKFQVLSPLISGILIAFVGYLLTGAVNTAFQNSQLQLGYVKEMQDLMAKLGDPAANFEQTKTTATALAAFGSQAIPPLLNAVESGEVNRAAGGEYGLRVVALADPSGACSRLGRVLENKTAAYNWFTHRAAIRILGAANCQSALPILQRYDSRLTTAMASPDDFKTFQATLGENPTVTKETVDQLKTDVEKSIKLLALARQP